MSSLSLLATLLTVLACCSLVPQAHGQIFEYICRDANCTDVALGPLALLPQCYRTPLGSIRLSINESNSNVLDLCFYDAEDCPPLHNGTSLYDNSTVSRLNESSVEQTCHSFVNGQSSECPFLRGMNGSLHILFTWDAESLKLLQDLIDITPSYQQTKRQILNNFFGLTEFGNWCGPGHGGTRDCCDGEKCSQCNYSQGLTSACLRQCPAKDQLDMACAVHDFCTTNYDYRSVLPGDSFSCSSVFVQNADYCACDCQLVRSARSVSSTNNLYRSGLIFLFTHVTNCWYQSTSGPVCNRGSNRILVTEFCS